MATLHPRWTPDELERALAATSRGVEAVAAACPTRARSAILNFGGDLHRLHQGQRPRHLARHVQQYLAPRRGQLACPLCGDPL